MIKAHTHSVYCQIFDCAVHVLKLYAFIASPLAVVLSRRLNSERPQYASACYQLLAYPFSRLSVII